MILALLLLTQVSAELDLNVGLPTPKSPNLTLTLQDRTDPNLRYKLVDEPAPKECMLRLERVTASDAVLACEGEKTDIHPNLKFIYDIRAKELVSRVTYMPYAFHGGRLIATNGERAVRVVLNKTAAEPTFRILASKHDPGRPMPPRYPDPPPIAPLPQSTYDQFAAARPRRVSDGYVRGHTTIEEIAGPRVKEDNLLWFGKSFYDGEGHTGIGGFGYYDPATKKYTLFAPPEIARYSASAIAVTPESVWLGLVHNGEWGSSGAGLFRFDRASQKAQRFESPDIPIAIRIEGARVIAATNFGITIVEGDRQRRYFVDQTSDGRLRMAEAVR